MGLGDVWKEKGKTQVGKGRFKTRTEGKKKDKLKRLRI